MRAAIGWRAVAAVIVGGACQATAPPQPDPEATLVARGERIFFEERFQGNGRTCGTCHRAEENFTLSPALIATLPDDDPLFVAEFQPDLAENFEKPELMRRFGLILENLDGFDDLENRFVLRGVPHVLGLRTSVDSPGGPRTGWSGDGSPGDGTLRSFAVGAVIQHFTKTTNRVAGVDFRLPTEGELDALLAFQLSLGRQQELELPLRLRDPGAARGQELFLDPEAGSTSRRRAGCSPPATRKLRGSSSTGPRSTRSPRSCASRTASRTSARASSSPRRRPGSDRSGATRAHVCWRWRCSRAPERWRRRRSGACCSARTARDRRSASSSARATA
jgi:hypothetical protein